MVDTHPDIAAQYHPRYNTLDLETLGTGSSSKVWWFHRANDGQIHEWPATPAHRTSGRGCAVCAGKRVQPGVNDLATNYPEIAKDWHPSRNELTPNEVSPGSDKRVWWRCSRGHEYENSISKRTVSGRGCAVCAGQTVLKGHNDLATLNPVLAAEWHPDFNGDLTASDVTAGTGRRIWWLGECGHPYTATVDQRRRGNGCAVCAGHQVLPGVNNLATTHPAIAAEWHPHLNIPLALDQMTAGSELKVSWLGFCGHTFQATIHSRALGGIGCGVCHGTQVVGGINDLATYAPAVAAQWHPSLNKTEASGVYYATQAHAWWKCSSGHEWRAVVRTRSVHPRTGCPKCSASGPEKELLAALENIFDEVEHDARLPVRWGAFSRSRVDIRVHANGINALIEYDGAYWHRNKIDKDTEKTLALLRAGYHIVRVREGDLPDLVLDSPRLLQIRRQASNTLAEIAASIAVWIESQTQIPPSF
ncbi:zinc-ribbon domain-containing protein [Nocardia sp. 2]|uniref:Zinc-ribbon domain-containing protein n=1 Tax=Nocardia acididurans TaxID=2802282 RepID=A0ABS1M284_9NOCA|nr:zinc-ribbon domain-containing protein [Nocardia acididurans]